MCVHALVSQKTSRQPLLHCAATPVCLPSIVARAVRTAAEPSSNAFKITGLLLHYEASLCTFVVKAGLPNSPLIAPYSRTASWSRDLRSLQNFDRVPLNTYLDLEQLTLQNPPCNMYDTLSAGLCAACTSRLPGCCTPVIHDTPEHTTLHALHKYTRSPHAISVAKAAWRRSHIAITDTYVFCSALECASSAS